MNELMVIESIVFPGYQRAELDGGESTYDGRTKGEGQLGHTTEYAIIRSESTHKNRDDMS